MNKLLMVCMTIFVVIAQMSAQGFYGVHSPNGLDVWAVGNGGNVFHSFDGGVTWGTYPQGTNAFRGICTYGSGVWIVSDNGSLYFSLNGGTSWLSRTLNGGNGLRAVYFVNAQKGWVVGVNGSISSTNDGGMTWNSQSTPTTQILTSLSFTDSLTGYAAGMAGTLLKTVNGGTTWTSIAEAGWDKDILSVRAKGQVVYVTGAEGFCYNSVNAGSAWSSLYLKTDSRVDVNSVAIRNSNVVFAGGGGFIRSSDDGGRNYTWAVHPLYAKLNDIFFYDDMRGWVCSEKNNAVMRTTDGGVTWQLPQGTTVNYAWTQKFSAGSIGNTFMIDPWNRNRIFVVMGSAVWMSADRGETWTQRATITQGGSTWSFYISPKDSNIWVAANSGGGKGIKRSTDRGVTWTTPLVRNFTSYGMPLEMDPDHPDTLIFAAEGTGSGPDGILYISKNFGATWDTLARTSFRSPCDVVIVPDKGGDRWTMARHGIPFTRPQDRKFR